MIKRRKLGKRAGAISIGKLTFIYSHSINWYTLNYGSHILDITNPIRRAKRIASYVRSLFPQAYAIQTHCCDTGWSRHIYLDVCLGRWDIERFCNDWDRASDGPARVSRITWREYFQEKRRRRAERGEQ